MILSERHVIKNSKELDRICFLSKNLYNAALYAIKQEFLTTGKWIRAYDLIKKFTSEDNPDFRAVSSNSAQQIIMILDTNLKSYFKAIKSWKRDNKKFTGCPKFPRYKHKTEGRNIFTYSTNQARQKGEYIHFPKKEGLRPLRTKCEQGSLKQVRIIPKYGYHVIEVIYEVQDTEKKPDNGKAVGIDLGVNNLATVAGDECYIINGKPLKSINQYYNKKKAILQSQLKKNHGKHTSKIIERLTLKRNNKVSDYLHKASKYIVMNCKSTTLVVGHNDWWKQKADLGKKTNQSFTDIPFDKFIRQLRYKSERQGLTFIEIDEGYTSRCSSFDLEDICKHERYIGKRVKRGLFKTGKGALVNADVNGALNILRKVKGDAEMPTYTGLVVNPIKINLYK